jgi:hypothetical protein
MGILKIILISVVLVAVALIGLATNLLLKRGGQFPNTHVGGNKHLKKNGVHCYQTQDKIEQRKVKNEVDYKNVKVLKRNN